MARLERVPVRHHHADRRLARSFGGGRTTGSAHRGYFSRSWTQRCWMPCSRATGAPIAAAITVT
jgi:hypothetical protein